MKINVDGAYNQDSNTGATGVVIRSSAGTLIAASARWMASLGSALLAEAEALRDGIRLLPQGMREQIIVETDCQDLVSLWNKRHHRSEIKAVLDDAEEMASNFSSFQLLHTRRESNFAAHLCAQHACSSLDSFVWSNPPSFLQHVLQFDCNNAV